MTTKIMKLVVDLEGNHNLLEADEIDLQRRADAQNKQANDAAEAAAKAEQRAALLERLGITEEEAKLLLG
jgi:hypothetical protein